MPHTLARAWPRIPRCPRTWRMSARLLITCSAASISSFARSHAFLLYVDRMFGSPPCSDNEGRATSQRKEHERGDSRGGQGGQGAPSSSFKTLRESWKTAMHTHVQPFKSRELGFVLNTLASTLISPVARSHRSLSHSFQYVSKNNARSSKSCCWEGPS